MSGLIGKAPSEASPRSTLGGGVHRGTSNRDDRGNTEDRRRRREYLVNTYRADAQAVQVENYGVVWNWLGAGEDPEQRLTSVRACNPGRRVWLEPACRCYRCGRLLTVDTVTVDRIVPGAHGGTYTRLNCRPACGPCNSETGATVRSES